MTLKLDRNDIIQIISTISSFVLTIVLPLVNYITFKNIIREEIVLSDLESRYNIIIIFAVIIGVMITGCTYIFFKYPKYSVNRGIVTLTHSVLNVLFLAVFSQMAIFNISFKGSGISLNLSGLFIILTAVLSLLIGKSLYDLIDFKLNQNYYRTFLRKQKFKDRKAKQKLVKCPNCKYMCQMKWSKCPICNSRLRW